MKHGVVTVAVAFAIVFATACFALAPIGGPSTVEPAYGDSVNVRVVVRGHRPPPDGLTAIADSYNIAVTWRNPPVPYSATLIEWYTHGVRRGTGDDLTWHQSESYYPPASWASVSAPMGATYMVRGTTCFEGDAAMSVPAQTSVVVTAPVSISSALSETGYAASRRLRARYGTARYAKSFESQLQVPGGTVNHTLGDHPISWSARLAEAPTVRVYRLERKDLPNRDRTTTPSHEWVPVRSARASFTDGYPAVTRLSFTDATPGSYKLVASGRFADGFTSRGGSEWSTTRYITLKATRFSTALKVAKPAKSPKRNKATSFKGTIAPRRAARVQLAFERKVSGRWRAHSSKTVSSSSTGAYRVSMRFKSKGTYRFRATSASAITGPYTEYTPATSPWVQFKVR